MFFKAMDTWLHMCVRLLLKSSSWLLLGDSMPVKVDVAVGDFRCLMTQELRD